MVILSSKVQIAKDTYKCIWCGGSIIMHHLYHRQVIKFNNEFQSNRYHIECFRAASLYPDELEEGYSPYSFKRGTHEEI